MITCTYQGLGANGMDCLADSVACRWARGGSCHKTCSLPLDHEVFTIAVIGQDVCYHCGFVHGDGLQRPNGTWMIEPRARNGSECYNCGAV
jgi:hypothetical protein